MKPPAALLACCLFAAALIAQAPVRGITAAPEVARAYDLVLDADFDGAAAAVQATCPPAPTVACMGLAALSL